MSCYRFSMGADCSFLSAPAKEFLRWDTLQLKKQKHADKRVWLKGRELKESKHLLQETRIFASYRVTINETLLQEE